MMDKKSWMKEYNARPEVKERNKQWFKDNHDKVKKYSEKNNPRYMKGNMISKQNVEGLL